MAGKRLLDAAKLVNAGTSVAKQHYVLRRQQWDVYTQTSSLAKAVKSQTDRVTVTAAAAAELARRFNETGPAWQQQQGQSQQRPVDARGEDVARRESSATVGVPTQGVGAARKADDTVNQAVEADHDDGTLSSLRKRELQWQAERQIPAVTADAQGEQKSTSGQDTFTEPTEHVSPELSSLPRTKIPKHTDEQGNNGDVASELNPDTFPTPHDQPAPDDINTDIFTSPRVSKMLGRSGSTAKNPYAKRQRLPPKPLPEMVAAREKWEQEKKAQAESAAPSPRSATGDPEMQDLAASIAQAAAMSETEPSRTDVDARSAETPYQMRESRVPSSRFGRLWQYGGLATSMAFGAVGESLRRVTGGGSSDGSLMLSEGNMNRLVAKLSRMRGAALKLGQMISFQDSKVLPPTINAVLQRVQDSADYMPPYQRDQVLIQNLGQDWRDLFSHFEEKPFAAASIGQVHKATLKSNTRDVAVKIQYPGVRDSIDSDLNNLSLLLTASRLLPPGMFLDRTIANARTELGWECDYEREAQSCIRFRELLHNDAAFAVPEIFAEASGPGVLTAEFMHGTGVTKLADLAQEDRDWIGTQILRLCLRELMEWRFMQTDPNWTNFLYDQTSKKLELLDFGASREYPAKFVEPYVSLLIAASHNDRAACRDLSIELGYLTGAEGEAMTKAHVDSVLVLAEPFAESAPEVYNFEGQTITDRVRANIGLMLRERLAPPPEETYSLHRKLSGAFLLCARLGSRVSARGMFDSAVKVWEGGEKEVKSPTAA
ncbi:hypothetical protein B0A55_12376 [Friedmanniomyces simplex]|uniref:ABC1 atypical kinase-like domain-containing protein n=3 Tax=Friedmanniomyces simplex TaxID=329884 RepID=A0A4U0VYP9_9PEZI|nr:hypothetical protein B0A55_12376 [Friedmanniomyces simplex]